MKTKMKKIISLTLAILMLMANTQTVGAKSTSEAKDISNHWAKETLSKWKTEGLLKGDAQGNLNPNREMTRAEFIAIVNRAVGYNATGEKVKQYKDVKETDWYYKDVMTALEKGYINGISDDRLAPENKITRQEVMVMVNKIAGLKDKKTELDEVRDKDAVASWAKQAVKNMIGNGYISGYNGQIMPTNLMKRAEAVVLLDAYKQNNRSISFKGEYELGEVNDLTLRAGNVKIKNSKVKDLIISETARGKLEIENVEIKGKVVNNSKNIEIYENGEKLQVKDGKLIKQAGQEQYKDGEYIGEANGYAGKVRVKVFIKNNRIEKVEMDKHYDDEPYMTAAKKIMAKMANRQNADVEAVSGATYSSNGIINAVKDALEQAKGKTKGIGESEFALKNKEGGKSKRSGAAGSQIETSFFGLRDGQYEGIASGHYVDSMKVRVTVTGHKIAKIELLSNGDDLSYFDNSHAEKLASKIISTQSTKIDTISGATNSSKGFINAVVKALESAESAKKISKTTDAENSTAQIVQIVAPDISVKNLKVKEDLIVTAQVAEGNLTLENVHVEGDLIVQGGGSNSIYLVNCKIDGEIKVEKEFGQRVRIVLSKGTSVKNKVKVYTPAIIETTDGVKIPKIELTPKLSDNQETEIKAIADLLDIRNDETKITVKKESKIKHIELPQTVEAYQKGKTEYKNPKKPGFALKIEKDTAIEEGSNKNRTIDEEILVKNGILTIKKVKELDKNTVYKDGVYYGDATGFIAERPLPVKVTVSGGKVTEIDKVEDIIREMCGDTKIDDGGSFEEKFRVVKYMVINKENPQEILYTLTKVSEISDKVMASLESKNFKMHHISEDSKAVLDKLNKSFDEVLGKHAFGEKNVEISEKELIEANQHSKKTDLKAAIRKKVALYFTEELGYSKEPLDAVSGATYTGTGTAKSIKNALGKMGKDVVDMRIVHNYKTDYNVGNQLDLSGFAVRLYDKERHVTEIPYSQFKENGIRLYNYKNGKEMKHGTVLNEEALGTLSTITSLIMEVEHVPSGSIKRAKDIRVKLYSSIELKDVKLQVAEAGTDIWYDTLGIKSREEDFIKNIYIKKSEFDLLKDKELKFRRITSTAEGVVKTFDINAVARWENGSKNYSLSIPFTALKINERENYSLRHQNLRLTLYPYDGDINPEKSFAENYSKQIPTLSLVRNANVDEKYLKDLFSGIFLNTKIIMKKAPDTSQEGITNMQVELQFEDKSVKNIDISVNVVRSNKAEEYKEFFKAEKLSLNAVVEPENFKDNAAVKKAVAADQLTEKKIKKELRLDNAFGEVEITVLENPDRSNVGNNTNTALKIKFKSDDSTIERLEVPTTIEPLKIIVPVGDKLTVDTSGMAKNYIVNATIHDIDKLKLVNPSISVGRKELTKWYIWNDDEHEKLQQNIGFADFKNFGIKVISFTGDEIDEETIITQDIVDSENQTLKIKVYIPAGGDEERIKDLKVTAGSAQSETFKATYGSLDSIYTITEGVSEELKKNEHIKRIIKAGEITSESIERDLELKAKAKAIGIDNVEVSLVGTVNRDEAGTSEAKIKLKFADSSWLEYDVQVDVREIPIYEFRVFGNNIKMKKEHNLRENINFDELTIYVKPYKVEDGSNGYLQIVKEGSGLVPITYKDFASFGLQIVRKDTMEEIVNNTRVSEIVSEAGPMNLSVYYSLVLESGTIKDYEKYYCNMTPKLADEESEFEDLPFKAID